MPSCSQLLLLLLLLLLFHWSLSDKCPQVSRTLLSIQADFGSAVVWIFSNRPLISKSFSPFTNPLVTVPRAPITIGITVTSMFHSFFKFPCKFEVLILFAFIQFYSVVSRDSINRNSAGSLFLIFFFSFFFFFFFLIIIRSGRLAEIRWFVCI